MRTSNQITVTLNETFLQTTAEQNKKIDKLFQMVEKQAAAPPTINNKTIVTTNALQVRKKHQCPPCKRMCSHKLKNRLENNAEKRWPDWTSFLWRGTGT